MAQGLCFNLLCNHKKSYHARASHMMFMSSSDEVDNDDDEEGKG